MIMYSAQSNFMLYTGVSFSGDSGGPVITYSGRIAAIHLGVVNEAAQMEKKSQQLRLSEVADAVDQVASNLSQLAYGASYSNMVQFQ